MSIIFEKRLREVEADCDRLKAENERLRAIANRLIVWQDQRNYLGDTHAAIVADFRNALADQEAEVPMADLKRLVDAFAASLLAKLIESERKYGWKGGWIKKDWKDDLLVEIRKHVEKGDPRDVAAYCAFAWFHGWSLAKLDAARGKNADPEAEVKP